MDQAKARLHTSYLFHNSCCSYIPMGNNQDNSVVRKIIGKYDRDNDRQVEEEVKTRDCDNIGMYRCSL